MKPLAYDTMLVNQKQYDDFKNNPTIGSTVQATGMFFSGMNIVVSLIIPENMVAYAQGDTIVAIQDLNNGTWAYKADGWG